MLSGLSFIVILLSLGVTVIYGFPIVRYFLMGAGLIGGIAVVTLKKSPLINLIDVVFIVDIQYYGKEAVTLTT